MKKAVSFICLVVCTLIWGTTFIAQDTGMDNIGPFTFNCVRFFVGFLAVAPFVFLFEKKKIKHQIANKTSEFSKLMIPVGTFLFLGCIFQQVSLLYTDVANSAFFTIFYVPMVPIIVYFLFSEKLHWSIWPSVLACVFGGYLLSDISDSTIRFGDSLVLIGALFWALHIIYIGKIINQFDLPFFIALIQNLIVSFFSFILVVIFEEINFSDIALEDVILLWRNSVLDTWRLPSLSIVKNNFRASSVMMRCQAYSFNDIFPSRFTSAAPKKPRVPLGFPRK